MYKNADKWFYAFITKMEYLNDKVSRVYIETDVYQTWMFNVSILDSFVVREHVTDDDIGKHITDEGIDTGEFVRQSYATSGKLDTLSIVVSLSADQTLTSYYGCLYGGVYSGLYYSIADSDLSGVGATNDLIETLVNQGKGDRIINIFMCPTAFTTAVNEDALSYYINPVTRPITIDGYTPKNKKMYCYPYSFLYVSNNNGGNAVYRYEFMTNKDLPQFRITGDFSPAPTIFLFPENYKGLSVNYEEKLSLNNYPMCAWNNDVYAQWLAQNKGALTLATLGAVSEIGVGAYTGNIPLATSGVNGVLTQVSQLHDRSIQPSQARGNTGGGGSNVAVGIQDFFFMPTTITREYAERIDKYFDMYGYKVDTVKVPNINTRPYWNYVQTIDINIKGAIPVEDMKELKSIYNKGVTIWTSGDNIGNYSLDNH
jgi:hypothetical protein